MNNNTYVLPLEGYEELEKRVSKMNKKHKSSISLNIISRSIMKGDNGIEFPVVEFELVGDKPLLGTHEVLAIKQIDGGHVLIFGSSTKDVPKKYWSLEENHCDHCATQRNRKTFLILRNISTGEILQVGKSCVKEYTNSLEDDIHKLYRLYALYEEVENFGWGDYAPSEGYVTYDVKKYLGIACKETEDHGYLPVSEALEQGKTPTKTTCWRLYLKFRMEMKTPEEYQKQERVEEILAWWLNQANRENDSFWLNVSGVLRDGYCSEKALGLIAFLPSAYEKHLARLRRLEEAFKFSSYFPTDMKVGDKVELEVVLRKRSYYENNFSYYGGLNGVYQFSDKDGHCFLWRTAAKSLLDELDLSKETKLLLSGTVKEFSEYKRTKQTVLTRCKVKLV